MARADDHVRLTIAVPVRGVDDELGALTGIAVGIGATLHEQRVSPRAAEQGKVGHLVTLEAHEKHARGRRHADRLQRHTCDAFDREHMSARADGEDHTFAS